MHPILYNIASQGFDRQKAMTCKSCKGRCSLWDWIATPLKWNPQRVNRGPYWFRRHEAKFRRVRDAFTMDFRDRQREWRRGARP